jgi:hypothetical protein
LSWIVAKTELDDSLLHVVGLWQDPAALKLANLGGVSSQVDGRPG